MQGEAFPPVFAKENCPPVAFVSHDDALNCFELLVVCDH